MPAEIFAQCACEATRPGDALILVGSHRALGNWKPEDSSAVLTTSPESFPYWQLPAPLVLEPGSCNSNGEAAEIIVDYKYVILRRFDLAEEHEWENLGAAGCDGDAWEDFGAEYAPAPHALLNGDDGDRDRQEDVGLPDNRSFQLSGDCVVALNDRFGQPAACGGAPWPLTWLVCSDWAPGLVGGGTLLGHGKVRNSHNPAFELHYRFPVQLFVRPRREQLEGTMAELSQALDLPPGLWWRIVEFADRELAQKVRCLCCA